MRKTLTLFFMLFITVPVILFVFSTCAFISSYIYEQKIETFETSVNNLAEYISSNYDTQIEGIEKSVQSSAILAYLSDPTDPAKQAVASDTFFDTFSVYDSASAQTLLSPNGEILLTSEENDPELTKNNLQILNRIQETEKVFTTLEFEEDIPLLTIAYPIYENNQLLGIFKRVTPLNYIEHFAHNINENEESVYILTNNNIGVIYAYSKENITAVVKVDPTDRQPLSQAVDKLDDLLDEDDGPRFGETDLEINGTPIIGFYSIIDNVNWICMITQRKPLLFFDLNMFQLFVIALSIVFIFIVYFGIKHYYGNFINNLYDYKRIIFEFLQGNHQIRCNTDDKFEILEELGNNINDALDTIESVQAKYNESSKELRQLVNLDPITSLANNKSLYNVIDRDFNKSPNQILMMISSGIYDQISKNYGNSVANRMLEIIADTLNNVSENKFFVSRLYKDTFCIFINNYEDIAYINQKINELRVRLTNINKVDDLQVKLDPSIAVVFKDEHILGRSDWLRLATELLEEVKKDEGSIMIFDFTQVKDIRGSEPTFIENILEKNIGALEGFSRSQRKRKITDN